jgi:hypothetical protein
MKVIPETPCALTLISTFYWPSLFKLSFNNIQFISVCTSKQFECSIDKSCIDITHRCDNVKNCADASDEKGCHPKTLITTTEEPLNPEPSTSSKDSDF